MRVITGKARGKRLRTLDGTDVRPTIDGVKESIFSAIQFDIEGRIVLDLFAGSGQLGIEALSRGAEKAFFVDANINAVNIVKENLRNTDLENASKVVNMPFTSFLRSTKETFDIAFIDPPYNYKIIQKALPVLVEKMSDNGIIVCEHEKECILPKKEGKFEIAKEYRHGRTTITIYRIPSEAEE